MEGTRSSHCPYPGLSARVSGRVPRGREQRKPRWGLGRLFHRTRDEQKSRWPRWHLPVRFLPDPALVLLVPQGLGQKLLLCKPPGPTSSLLPHCPQRSVPRYCSHCIWPCRTTLVAAPCGQEPALAISVSSAFPRTALWTLSRGLADVDQAQ